MKQVVFITPPTLSHRTSEESLGIAYLSAILRQNHIPVKIIDNWLCNLSISDTMDVLSKIDCAFIGISSYISSLNQVAELIAAIRSNYSINVPIVCGGFGPTFHSEQFLNAGSDYVIKGEAEQGIMQFYRHIIGEISAKQVPGLSYFDSSKRLVNSMPASVSNLDSLPFPSRDTIDQTLIHKNPIHISTSRGCLAHCTFCSVIAFDRLSHTNVHWRQRSISNIIDEIESLHTDYGVTNFKIVDDSFIEPPRDDRWAEQLACELEQRNLKIKFRTQIRADRVTEPLVAALSHAGWYATSVGIENWSPTALRRMGKTATLQQNLDCISLLAKYQVYTQMGMILFDHATTIAELKENYVTLKSLRWPVTKGIFTEMYASEGTPFMRLLRKKNLESDDLYGNSKYLIADESTKLIYDALKTWHTHHSAIYDHSINPIAAPKSLPEQGYQDYWDQCISLFETDVGFFGRIISAVEQGISAEEIRLLCEKLIVEKQPFYTNLSDQLTYLDKHYGLSYDAEPNKFLE